MGSTACTVIIDGKRVYCANLGDSRAVMAVTTDQEKKDKSKKTEVKIVELSKDHKPGDNKE